MPNALPDNEERITLANAAKLFGVTYPTIWKYAMYGVLPRTRTQDEGRIKLQYVRRGPRRVFTSVEAMQRFRDELNAADRLELAVA